MAPRRGWAPTPGRGPERLLVGVGLVVGLLFAFLYPPFAAGADEATHVARAVEMAHGRLTPGEIDGEVGSPIPSSYRRDQDLMIRLLFQGGPFDGETFSELSRSRPDWSDTYVADTLAATAANPLAYAPSAAAMVVPDRLGWSGVWVLWAGRVGNLLVYLAVVWVALRVATAFRWTLAIAALFPMNLGIAASVTPDALTISAVLLVVAVWTRVWRPDGVGADATPDDEREQVARSQGEALAALGLEDSGDDTAPQPSTPRTRPWADRRDRLWAWFATPVGTGVMVFAAGLLLALTKPPYYLVLAAFPALLPTAWRDLRLRAAAVGSMAALVAGGVLTVLSTSGGYQGVTAGINGEIAYQPDVQRERLLGDPLAFLGRVLGDWFGELNHRVQLWVRHVGYLEITLPGWVSWVVVVAFVVAAMLLDRRDLLGLRRWARAIWALMAAGMVFVLYVTAYLYQDETVEGDLMGLQLHRYVSPFFAVAVMGWAPRFVLAPAAARVLDRVPRWVPVALVVATWAVVMVAAVRTWNVVGWSVDTS